MVSNNNVMSGSAMAVLAGIVLIVAPWFVPINLSAKFGLSVVGIVLVWAGLAASRG